MELPSDTHRVIVAAIKGRLGETRGSPYSAQWHWLGQALGSRLGVGLATSPLHALGHSADTLPRFLSGTRELKVREILQSFYGLRAPPGRSVW